MNPAPTGALARPAQPLVNGSRTSRVTASLARGNIGISWAVIFNVVPDRLKRTPAMGPIVRSGKTSTPPSSACRPLNQYVAPGLGKPEETRETPPLTRAGSTPDKTAWERGTFVVTSTAVSVSVKRPPVSGATVRVSLTLSPRNRAGAGPLGVDGSSP